MGIFGDYAQKYYENGLAVIPVNGKKPLVLNWNKYSESLPTQDEVDKWAGMYSDANIGIVCGKASNLTIVDFDFTGQESEKVEKLLKSILPPTSVIKKGARGWSNFYQYKNMGDIKSVDRNGQRLVDFLSDEKQTVIPPSVHPDTKSPYLWTSPDTLESIAICDLPKLDNHVVSKILELEFIDLTSAESIFAQRSGRHDVICSYAWAIIEKVSSLEELAKMIFEYDLKKHSEAPYFSDKKYFKRKEPMKSALDIAKRIEKTVVASKKKKGVEWSIEKQSKIIIEQGVVPLGKSDLAGTFPHMTGKNNKPVSTIENFKYLMQSLGVTIRYNVITKDEEILIPNESFLIDNKANASFAWILSKVNEHGMPNGNVDEFISYLLGRNLYNPVVQWVTSKPWDKKSRLQELFNTIEIEKHDYAEEDKKKNQLKEIFIKRWLISAVAAAFKPSGISAQGVLVFQGDQNLGKTSWLKSLVPSELNLANDGVILRPDDKDSVKQAVSFWLIELGELDATFKKSDIAQLKSFLTKDKDVLRRAYARRDSEYARRTVFFASVNPKQFLQDPTGNRRFWTVECESVNFEHGIDMQQLWAEVYEDLFLKGEKWYLTQDEVDLLNVHNEDFTAVDPVAEKLLEELDWESPESTWEPLSTVHILQRININKPTHRDLITVGSVLKNKALAKRTVVRGVKKYLTPPLKAIYDRSGFFSN